jgi:hypothetical protein
VADLIKLREICQVHMRGWVQSLHTCLVCARSVHTVCLMLTCAPQNLAVTVIVKCSCCCLLPVAYVKLGSHIHIAPAGGVSHSPATHSGVA